MRKIWAFIFVIIFALILSACGSTALAATVNPSTMLSPVPANTIVPTATLVPVSSANPCVGAPPPSQWKHVVVLMFENKKYKEVIGEAPYITSLANKCGTATDWKDADTRVNGSEDEEYKSKPSYATLTNGLSPSTHGLVNDSYDTTTNVDNIYNQLNLAGKSFKDYYEAEAGGCGVRFKGDYHDPIRFYTNVSSICDAHDVPLSTFMSDLNSGNLPAFSIILPNNEHNMHDNEISNGDSFAQSILDPILDSKMYANGDLAIFFLWDENSPVPNVLLAPSVKPGTTINSLDGNPISHFSALRTWEEMLGLPLLGDTNQAPSLLPYFEGR